jgi:predicted transport protein
MPMFRRQNGKLTQIKEVPFKKEKDLQDLTEKNIESIFGLQFVRTEYSVQSLFIDTLSYDPESKSFVIIEYKRDRSFSVVDQGFSYLSLMLNNKAEFVLEYNRQKKASLNKEDIDWTQSKIIFIARSFTAHQQNAVNFKNMPFELWEAVQFENELVQYRKLETSDSAESLEQIKYIGSETKKVAKEVKSYTEEDVVGESGKVHDLYLMLKDKLNQSDMELTSTPKKIYVGFQVPDNWRNVFNIQKYGGDLVIHFMRSKPKDFDDPKNRLKFIDKSREHWGQDITMLRIQNEGDIPYAMLIIQQAYDRFIKEFGS